MKSFILSFAIGHEQFFLIHHRVVPDEGEDADQKLVSERGGFFLGELEEDTIVEVKVEKVKY